MSESIKAQVWGNFSDRVHDHIENYVVPQYGDHPNDPSVDYTVADCVKQAQRYLARVGKGQRPGEELRDFLKAAHWIQIGHDKLATDAPAVAS